MFLKVEIKTILVKKDLPDIFCHISVSASNWWLIRFFCMATTSLKNFDHLVFILLYLFLTFLLKVYTS